MPSPIPNPQSPAPIIHVPEDMTATVSAETTLGELQARLGERGQWLPIDPSRPERLTIGALLANDESGPRRFGYGTIRDYLLGIKVTLADGRLIKAGGKVVKNVAGYDLCKLFIGSRGSLGTIAEATFKLRPLPEAEQFVQIKCKSLAEVAEIAEKTLDSSLTPVVLDLDNQEVGSQESGVRIVVGFAGTKEEVEWQLVEARKLGISEPSNLDYDAKFWATQEAGEPHKLSVLPSKISEGLAALGKMSFIARAGNGIIWYRGDVAAAVPSRISKTELPQGTSTLQQRVKDAYDPKHILPEMPI